MVEAAERYTAEQLLQAARALHLSASERLVVDWVSLGLLDRPEHRGAGQGRGSGRGTWPAEQLQLFLSLLKQRTHVKRVTTLANIPVAIWLLWGDRYVPLRQVRRALATWAGGQHTSDAAARRAARQLVADFGTKEHQAKGALIDFLTDALRGRRPDIDALQPYMQRLGEGETVKAGDVQLEVTPDIAMRVFSARVEALQTLGSFSDASFRWARFIYNVGRADYDADAPELLRHQRFAHMFEDTSLLAIFNQACLDLVTTLGISRLHTPDPSQIELANSLWEADDLRPQIPNAKLGSHGVDRKVETTRPDGAR